MYLKSITLKGFKSFAQPTTLQFEPGITCVVGPNGSGKSNVVDALAWVMGEQGAKTLRGGKMEDVIFAGTATKGPLGRAEVQLTIDNADGALPIEYAEVTISRVLFRNGASEYAINGESCRLLDLQELLSDTGLGREMHVIVGQGQLDTVLKASPLERRAFIEEAAGILKYRRRKEKTERKLDAMQLNLTRLQDLAAELRRNLKPLGRQADIARQAQQIGALAREAKSKLLAHQIRDLSQQLELASRSENERRAESSYAQSQLSSTKTGIQEIETQLVSSELDELRQRLFGFEAAESKLRSLQNLAQQRISLLGQQQLFIKDGEVEDLKGQFASSESDLKALESSVDSTAASLRELEQKRLLASEALSQFEVNLLSERSEAEQSEAERSKLLNSLSVLESRILGFETQIVSLNDSLVSSQKGVLDLQAEQEVLAPDAGSVSDSELRVEYENSQVSEQAARGAVEEARDALHSVERERDAIAAKHSALGMTLEQADGSVEVRKANLPGIQGLLAESVVIESGYEIAIAAALGSMADAIVVESKEQAVAALRYLKAEGLGRAEFLIVAGNQQASERAFKYGLVSAQSVVSAPRVIFQSLEAIYLADDLDQALAALEKDSNLNIITKDGDFVSEALVRGGGTKQPSKLELIAERDSAAKRLKALASEIELKTVALENTRNASALVQEGVKSALAKLQEHDAELAARAQRVGRVIAQVDAAKNDVKRLEKDIAAILESKTAGEVELAQLALKIEAMPKIQTVLANEDERAGLIATLETARQAELEVRISIGTFAERRINASKEVAVLRGRVNEAIAASEQDRKVNQHRERQLAAAQAGLSILPHAISLTERLAGGVRVEVRDKEAKRTQQTERLALLRSQATGLEARYSELNQGVHEVEMRNHELKLKLANLTERISTELAVSAEVLLGEYPADESTREELDKGLRQAESKLSQLGAFNPLALEEFAALEQRHQYLAEQLEDLAKARSDLMGIIKDLDGKMQSIFAAAFEDTKLEFEKIFPILFPGGTGSISLTEPDDLSQTGLEVSVRPAGKRIERMSLLSGGERSLAAVALLIAIFKARPSPFYVLDEVEAALDDSNLGRLLEVIESLRKSSQLIIVTHQKRTMEIADALYGVSMGQDGMSAVIGQKLEKRA